MTYSNGAFRLSCALSCRFRCAACQHDFCGECLATPYHASLTCAQHRAPKCLYCSEALLDVLGHEDLYRQVLMLFFASLNARLLMRLILLTAHPEVLHECSTYLQEPCNNEGPWGEGGEGGGGGVVQCALCQLSPVFVILSHVARGLHWALAGSRHHVGISHHVCLPLLGGARWVQP